MPKTLTPTYRVNEFGVRAFSPLLSADVTGRTVIVRDWYGAAEIACVGVETGRNGYPSALKFTRKDGRLGLFSLHTAREIEVLSKEPADAPCPDANPHCDGSALIHGDWCRFAR